MEHASGRKMKRGPSSLRSVGMSMDSAGLTTSSSSDVQLWKSRGSRGTTRSLRRQISLSPALVRQRLPGHPDPHRPDQSGQVGVNSRRAQTARVGYPDLADSIRLRHRPEHCTHFRTARFLARACPP